MRVTESVDSLLSQWEIQRYVLIPFKDENGLCFDVIVTGIVTISSA